MMNQYSNIRTEIRQFWHLIAGAADFYSKFHYPNHRRMYVNSRTRVRMPLPINTEVFVLEDNSGEFPSSIDFHYEDIVLKKYAWTWLVNGECRLYTIVMGAGVRSDVWAYSDIWMIKI